MGVDAYIFAEQSKRCFYFDRKSNLFSYPDHEPHFGELQDRLNNEDRLAAVEIIWMCNFNIVRKHRAGWNRDIMRFVVRTPDYHNERFFVVSDHDCPDSHDVIDAGSYVTEEYAGPKYWDRRRLHKNRKHIKSERLMTDAYKFGRAANMIRDLERALSAGYVSPFSPGFSVSLKP